MSGLFIANTLLAHCPSYSGIPGGSPMQRSLEDYYSPLALVRLNGRIPTE